MKTGGANIWADGDAYEGYVGRWSRLAAGEFLRWLALPRGGRWLDIGCGTGVMAQAIERICAPGEVVGVDASEAFVAYARARNADTIHFVAGAAEALPVETGSFDAVVSGLALNSLRHTESALAEMRRAARPGGEIAAYVWDYAGEMQMMRLFWDAAAAFDTRAAAVDPGRADTMCHPGRLADLFRNAGLARVVTRVIDVPTVFRDFADLWLPLLSRQGMAPSYCMSLSGNERVRLRERLRATLPIAPDGRIPLIARAFAVRGAAA